MQVNSLSTNSLNPSFAGLRFDKMSKICKKAIQENVLPKLDYKVIDDLENMGYDVVLKTGNGVDGTAFDVFLSDQHLKKEFFVSELKLHSFFERYIKKLPKEMMKTFVFASKHSDLN